MSCTLQFFKGGIACVHLVECLAYHLHILTVCPIRQALRLLEFLRCGSDNSRCWTVRHLILVTLDTPSDLLALVEVTQRFRSRHLRPRIALFLLRKHKFQVDLVVGIVQEIMIEQEEDPEDQEDPEMMIQLQEEDQEDQVKKDILI